MCATCGCGKEEETKVEETPVEAPAEETSEEVTESAE